MTNTKLVEARTDAGLTQKALADILGVSPKTVSRWEAGVHPVGVKHLVRIGQTCGVPVTELIGAV